MDDQQPKKNPAIKKVNVAKSVIDEREKEPVSKKTLAVIPNGTNTDQDNKLNGALSKEEDEVEIREDVKITPQNQMSDSLPEDDLALGASASPTQQDADFHIPEPPPMLALEAPSSSFRAASSSDLSTNDQIKLYSSPRPAANFVGLVNQAMTCYLNSLLQALYMTPEFRNALYTWEFDGVDENKSIPYQLQKLFLNLQTSNRTAVETTDLTRSFGWDSSEAWQQHDIQELCRVMFDALEQKFKNTKQADLINRLYEGKMIDYLKCLECGTEKQREDTFLDIPLPVKPFGNTVAYESVEEALRGFVQPEILNGNNQYSCEICNKKCDAHKGLKFSKFPYILTLHMKRFDFDYQTFNRIKLNDKVTFPQVLNLNSYLNTSSPGFACQTPFSDRNGHENGEVDEKMDEDEPSATDHSQTNGGGINSNGNGIHTEEVKDEGLPPVNENGPYIYELFAIMIHSGSARYYLF